MNKSKKILELYLFLAIWGTGLALILSQDQDAFLRGKVKYFDKENLPLEKKMALVREEFKETGAGDFYLVGYSFMSRNEGCHHGGECSRPYRVTVKNNRIKMNKNRSAGTEKVGAGDSEPRGEKAAMIILCQALAGGKVIDSELVDLDKTYTFEEIVLYWLGEADTQDSFRFLQGEFKRGNRDLQKSLVFIISRHENPGTYDFLSDTAMADYDQKIRESAIFWLGNYKDARSLENLKKLYQEEKELDLKKKIVFALQMSNHQDALKELIRIAKTENNQLVRKNAIFWLGQKATEECIKALKDMVGVIAEDTGVKKSAVFAISQLPQEKSVPLLIEIATSNSSPEVRKNAIFWLGQIDDERAIKFFEEILLKK